MSENFDSGGTGVSAGGRDRRSEPGCHAHATPRKAAGRSFTGPQTEEANVTIDLTRIVPVAVIASVIIGNTVRAEVLLVETDVLGEAQAGYFGFATGSRYERPPRIFDEPLSATEAEFPDDIIQPLIDTHYLDGRAIDLGPADSLARIDAMILGTDDAPDRIRRLNVFAETKAAAPGYSGSDDFYVTSGLVQFAFFFEVTDEPAIVRADGMLSAAPYSSTELRLNRATYLPDGTPTADSQLLRERTQSTQEVGSNVALEVAITLDPGLYFISSTTSALRSAYDPGTALATQNIEVLFGGGTYRWVDPGGGLYSDGDNWDSGLAAEIVDHALFDIVNGGYVVAMDEDAAVASLTVSQGTISLDFANNAGQRIDVDGAVTVGETAGVRAGLDVIGGTLNTDNIIVGATPGADALVTLREGAVLEFETLSVSSTGSGMAQFYALSGAALAVGAGDAIDITGAGSAFGVEQLAITAPGSEPGHATLAVRNGALASVDGSLVITNGAVTVDGVQGDSDSTLEVAAQTGALFVENTGTLTVSDGAFVQIGSPVDNPFGDLVVNTTAGAGGGNDEDDIVAAIVADETAMVGSPVDDDVVAAAIVVPAAAVTITGEGSQLAAFGTVAIGAESTGAVAVNAGASLAAKRIVLGSAQASGSDGSLVAAGAGAQIFASELVVGENDAGSGTLHVNDGANVEFTRKLSINNGEVHLAATPGDADDPPHLLVGTEDLGEIAVGNAGRFAVTHGARVQIGTSPFDITADLFVDADAPDGEAAPVVVTGEGSSLLAFRRLAIGSVDDGRMEVSAGAALTATTITLGSALFDGVFGRLDVTGPVTTLFAHEMYLGDVGGGGGSLLVTSGAEVGLFERLELLNSAVLVDGGAQGDDSRLFVGEANGGAIRIGAGSRFTVSDGAVVEIGSAGSPDGEVFVDAAAPSSERAPLLISGEGSSLRAFGSVAVGFFEDGNAAVEDGGTLAASQVSLGIAPDASGELTVRGAGSSLTAGVVNVGGTTGALGTLQTEAAAVVEIAERLVVNEMGAVWVLGDSAITVGSAVTPVAGSLVIGPGGELWGTGSIFADRMNGGGLDNFGTIYPGSSPGTLTIDGDYFQGESGVLVIEIGGTGAGSGHDVLNVLGDITIEGTVVFEFIEGFAPGQGQSFDFLHASGVVDLTQAHFEIGNLAPGFSFDILPGNGGFQMLALNDGAPVPLPPGIVLLPVAAAIALRKKVPRARRGPRN